MQISFDLCPRNSSCFRYQNKGDQRKSPQSLNKHLIYSGVPPITLFDNSFCLTNISSNSLLDKSRNGLLYFSRVLISISISTIIFSVATVFNEKLFGRRLKLTAVNILGLLTRLRTGIPSGIDPLPVNTIGKPAKHVKERLRLGYLINS